MALTKRIANMTPEERSQHMRDLRSKVKNPGFKSMDELKRKEIASLGGKASSENLPKETETEKGS